MNVATRNLILAINSRQKDIDEFERKAFEVCSNWRNEAALQGSDLIKVKSASSHDEWKHLFLSGQITVARENADRYIKIATEPANEDSTLRQTVFLLCPGETGERDSQPKRWPAYTEAIGKALKLLTLIERNPIQKWPQSEAERLRGKLLPVVAQLWPEKFVTHSPGHD